MGAKPRYPVGQGLSRDSSAAPHAFLRALAVDPLVRIRKEPEVARRWGAADIQEEIGEGFIGNDAGFVIEADGEVVGAIQYGEEDDPMYRHASMDIFLATSRHGQGLGPEAIRVLARHLFEERGHHRLAIDPAADNVAAIRAYERVGFRRVGIMRSYERGPDGVWHDGLMMYMLREEFRPWPGDAARTLASSGIFGATFSMRTVNWSTSTVDAVVYCDRTATRVEEAGENRKSEAPRSANIP